MKMVITLKCSNKTKEMMNEFKTVRDYINANPEMMKDTEEDLKAFEAGTYEAGSSKLLQKMEAAFGPLDDRKN